MSNWFQQSHPVTPQQHNTYTSPMAHAWGGSVMIVVCVLVIRIVKPTKMEKDKASWGYLCKS
jgi:hypothetical protein